MIRVLAEVRDPAPERLRIEGERFHHLAHVLRVREGQTVEVFDGRGRAFEAKVAAVLDDAVELVLGEARSEKAERRITIVQGLPKGDKLEWIIEKATELGAAAILPVSTQRSVVRLKEDRAGKRLTRWRRIAEEAARQTGRADVPEVLAPSELWTVHEAVEPGTHLIVLDEEERSRSLRTAVGALHPLAPLGLIVGPEGGFERAEVEGLVERGAVAVTLGGNVLRTETAALAALAAIRTLDGVLG